MRQAIALAGGYDIMRFRMNNPFLEQADLQSEYRALWTEFAKEQAPFARLQASLMARRSSTTSPCEDTAGTLHLCALTA